MLFPDLIACLAQVSEILVEHHKLVVLGRVDLFSGDAGCERRQLPAFLASPEHFRSQAGGCFHPVA
jgi:hypothetical protein